MKKVRILNVDILSVRKQEKWIDAHKAKMSDFSKKLFCGGSVVHSMGL